MKEKRTLRYSSAMPKITTQPYKGTSDWLPNEYQIQKYIFDTWREVCIRFGYKEYLTPLIEYADIYRAKSGDVKDELFTLQDRAGRDLALRPEMTPSVTRMVAGIYKEAPKPIRLFSIAPFYRNEAPQKGRTREFWQLNADIFGDNSIKSDLEILILGLELMLAFNSPIGSFKLYFNSRALIEEFFEKELQISEEAKQKVARIMDKYGKMENTELQSLLQKENLDAQKVEKAINFLEGKIALGNSQGYSDIQFLEKSLKKLGYADYIEFRPSIIRGFEYYDGMIFEVFDLNPENPRSLFGGGRYNGLADIFGVESFPATGFAPGNSTTRLFLQNWNLIPNFKDKKQYYLPLLDEKNLIKTLELTNILRRKGLNIENELAQTPLTGALRKADKTNKDYILILGENEITNNQITIKDLKTGGQQTKTLTDFLSTLS